MNTFNKVLISLAASLMASQAEAKSIYNSCLVLSDQTAGQETGEFFTNADQLTSSAVTDDMRLHSFKTCTDAAGYLQGLQFFMSIDPYSEANIDSAEELDMGAIGQMAGECQTLRLHGGLDRIRASSNGINVLNIRFYRGNLAKTYGAIGADHTQWQFTEENPLVGVYGRHSVSGIDQLGFITLDTACQAAAEEAVEEEEEEVVEEVEELPEEEDVQEDISELEATLTSEVSGLPFDLEMDLLTLIIIGVGVVVFIVLLTVSICACRAKKNQENKIMMVTAQPEQNPVRDNKKRQQKKKVIKELQQVNSPTDIENGTNHNTPAALDFDKKTSTFSNKVSAYPALETPAHLASISKDEEIGL